MGDPQKQLFRDPLFIEGFRERTPTVHVGDFIYRWTGQYIKLLSKSEIRNCIRQRRQNLTPLQVASLSCSICWHALRYEPFFKARTIALYLPIDNEVDTSSLLTDFSSTHKQICVPVVEPDSKRLLFARYKPGDPLCKGRYGIMEPLDRMWVDLTKIELFFLPLVGFDRSGGRLGYGGGYYDRVLSALLAGGATPQLVGLAFKIQEVAQLPCEKHDVSLHYIVTEDGVRSFTY